MKEFAATEAEIEAVAQVENISNCSLNVGIRGFIQALLLTPVFLKEDSVFGNAQK